MTCVAEGWWHPNTNSGRVHDHPENPGRGWSHASHRLCEPVYTKRPGREGPDMRAHRLADEIVKALKDGKRSLYNAAREILIDEFVRSEGA